MSNTTGDGMEKLDNKSTDLQMNKTGSTSGSLFSSFLLHGPPKKRSSGFSQYAEKMMSGRDRDDTGLSPNTLKNLMNPFGIRRTSSKEALPVPPTSQPPPPASQPSLAQSQPPSSSQPPQTQPPPPPVQEHPPQQKPIDLNLNKLTIQHQPLTPVPEHRPPPLVTYPSVAAVVSSSSGGGINDSKAPPIRIPHEFRAPPAPLPLKGTPRPMAVRPTHQIQNPIKSKPHKTPIKEKQPHQKSNNNNNNWKFSTEFVKGREYLVLRVLGKGGSGEVLLVMEEESRELFALKKVHIGGLDRTSLNETLNEVELLYTLRDTEFIIHISQWEVDDKSIKILMEYGQCDLASMIRKQVLSLHMLKFYWERMLRIVQDIHQRKIVHADLKPANFVWVNGIIKLIDFGIASRLKNDNTSIAMLCPKGTLNYVAPEILTPNAFGESKMSPKSDIWSLGVILYQMAYGVTPWQDIGHSGAKMNQICSGTVHYPQLPHDLANSGLVEVLQLCFLKNPKERPTATDLLLHPFLTSATNNNNKSKNQLLAI